MQSLLARWNNIVGGTQVVRSFGTLEAAILRFRSLRRGRLMNRPERNSFQYTLDGVNWLS